MDSVDGLVDGLVALTLKKGEKGAKEPKAPTSLIPTLKNIDTTSSKQTMEDKTQQPNSYSEYLQKSITPTNISNQYLTNPNDIKSSKNESPSTNKTEYIITSICCPEDVISGNLITKEKRQELFGKVAGGAGSRNPEEFQRQKIIEGTGIGCPKTNIRINLRTNTLKDIAHPNIKSDGFDYSEDFDGVQSIKNKKVYINLKCIVGKGGNQTRSLREVYWFVEGQLNSLKSMENVYFANILDGDEAHSSMSKFEYILALPAFESVKNSVYIGDLKGYFDWFKKTFPDE